MDFRDKSDEFSEKAQHSFPKRGQGGRVKGHLRFSESSSKFGTKIVPKINSGIIG